MPSSACQTCALRSEEHTSELQSHDNLVCRLLLAKKYPWTVLAAGATQIACAGNDWGAAGGRIGGGGMGHRSARRRAFFFNDTATTEIYTLSLHDALPI